jgi:Fur family ferric uptake transcriptional regulator
MTEAQKLLKDFPDIYHILTNHMDEKKMRKTSERYYILSEIYKLNTHFDVDTLYKNLSDTTYRISRATIYNNLELFLECGLIVKHHFGQNLSLYEKSFGYKQHDHFICNQCQSIIEFCDPRLHQIKKSLEEILNVTVDSHSLYLYGKCSNEKCQKGIPQRKVK